MRINILKHNPKPSKQKSNWSLPFFTIYVASLLSSLFTSFFLSLSHTYAQDSTINQKGVNWAMGQWYVNGAYNWTGMEKDLDLMKQAGIKYVRFSFGNHTQSSCSSTGFYTRLANEFDERGLVGLASISIPNRLTTTATAEQINSYKNWLNTMVNCYKDRFSDWEVWNEPNNSNFWNINPSTTDNLAYSNSVGYYVVYLEATYSIIKSIDPASNVILGGITQNWNIQLSDGRTVGTMTRWIDEFIRQQGYLNIDSWAFHPYADYDPQRNYNFESFTGCGSENIRRIYEFKSYTNSTQIPQNHRNKPIWLTEIGFTSTASKYPGNTKGSESEKALCLTNTWEKFSDYGIQTPIFWYDFSQDNLGGTSNPGYSLIKTNKSTGELAFNPAYYAYKNLWSQSQSPLPQKPGDTDADGDVDNTDYNNFISDYASNSNRSDFNRDGVVNIFDYNLLVTNFDR